MIPTRFAHRSDLGCNHVVNNRAAEGIVILPEPLHRPRKPARALETVDLFEHRALGLERVIERRRLDWPPGKTVEMWVRESRGAGSNPLSP